MKYGLLREFVIRPTKLRIDLYEPITGSAWEIKPVSTPNFMVIAQLIKYRSAMRVYMHRNLLYGRMFGNQTFYTHFFIIDVFTPARGVIKYDFRLSKFGQAYFSLVGQRNFIKALEPLRAVSKITSDKMRLLKLLWSQIKDNVEGLLNPNIDYNGNPNTGDDSWIPEWIFDLFL